MTVINTNTIFSANLIKGSLTNIMGGSGVQPSFDKALDDFYQIHQQSQLGGVPTSIYNKAVERLGLDSSDPFAGIHALEESGYQTCAPSINAILQFGKPSSQDVVLAQLNLINSSTIEEDQNLVQAHHAIQAEISQLNELGNGILDEAKTYYEAAKVVSQKFDLNVVGKFTLDEFVNEYTKGQFSNVHKSLGTINWLQSRVNS